MTIPDHKQSQWEATVEQMHQKLHPETEVQTPCVEIEADDEAWLAQRKSDYADSLQYLHDR